MPLTIGIWGEDKTGKTSLALSCDRPIDYFEFDLGGYERARWRFQDTDKSLCLKRYVIPMPGILESIMLKPTKIITGIKELWYIFLKDYMDFLNSDIPTAIIDTGTLLWECTCNAFLQEKQELQAPDDYGNTRDGKPLRVQLQQQEYREPNTRMRAIVYQAKAHDKNLIMTHHARDEYRPGLNHKTGGIEQMPTGNRERSGFSSLGDGTDLMLHTYLNDGDFWCEICSQSAPKGLVGNTFKNPCLDDIIARMKMIKGEV